VENRKVRCRTCGGVFYETTDKYEPGKKLTGDMLRLCKPYSTYQWPTYDGSLASKSTSRFLMFCCNCAGYISTTGELCFVDEEEGEDEPENRAIVYKPMPEKREKLTLTPEELASGNIFTCEKCGKVCKSKAGLLAHMRCSSPGTD